MAYPASLDSFTPKVDDVNDVMAIDVNELQTAIAAIETELGTDPAGGAADVKTRLAHSINDAGYLEFDDSAALTIAAGAITITQNFHRVDTEAAASADYLDSIAGNSNGMVLFIRPVSSDRSVIIRHDIGGGNIYCAGATNITLDVTGDVAILVYDGTLTKWLAGKLAAGTGITGGGASSQVAFYSAISTLTSSSELTFSTTTGLVVNESGGTAVDVRMESDNNAYMAFLDASADSFGIGTAAGGEIAAFTAAAGLILNEGGAAAMDLRAESDNNAYMLFLDSSADSLGIGTSAGGEIAAFTAAAGVILNEGGAAAMDLRAESDTEANMLFLDSSADTIYLGGNPAGLTVAKGGVTTIATATAGALVIGNGAAGVDYNVTFNGETNDGVFVWQEDEDQFQFTDNLRPYGRLIVPMGEIAYFSTTGTTVTIAAQSDGSTNMVVVAPATALSSGAYEFDNGGSNNGRLRYTGAVTKMFHVACTVSLAPAAANDEFVLGVAKGGTVVAASKIIQKVATAGDTQSTALHIMVELATNEYIELYVGNITDTDDLTIKTLNLFAMGM